MLFSNSISFVIKTSSLTSINHIQGCQKVNSLTLRYTVKLLLSDQLRDHQKAVVEEKGSPNATKVHHTKQSDNIYYIYFNNTLLSTKSYVVGTHLNRLIEAIQMSTNKIGLS